MKTTYKRIEIEYQEDRNVWTFTLRGRDRYAVSLKSAKEAIDKPAPKEEKPFTRVEGYIMDRWEGVKAVTVTSVAEKAYDNTYFWIKNAEGNRSKEYGVILKNEKNDALIEEYKSLVKQQEQLASKISELKDSMEKVTVE